MDSGGDALKVNLGCGTDVRDGFVNVDIDPTHGPDVVADAVTYLRDLPDSSVGEILAIDLLEHLADPLSLMREAHRVLSDEGVMTVRVPHRRSKNAWLDWSHIHTDWCREKMHWLESPPAWVGFRFHVVDYHEERPPRFALRFWKDWARTWGNITVVYMRCAS